MNQVVSVKSEIKSGSVGARHRKTVEAAKENHIQIGEVEDKAGRSVVFYEQNSGKTVKQTVLSPRV